MSVTDVLPVVINILLVILLTVGIVIGIKLIMIMNKVDKVVQNVDRKVNALNGVFGIVEVFSNRMELVFSKIVEFISSTIDKATTKKTRVKKGKVNNE